MRTTILNSQQGLHYTNTPCLCRADKQTVTRMCTIVYATLRLDGSTQNWFWVCRWPNRWVAFSSLYSHIASKNWHMMESCGIYFDTGTFHVSTCSTCCRLRHLLCTVLFFCSCPCRNPHHIHRTLQTGINYLYLSLSWCLLLAGFLNHPRYQGQIRVAFMQNSVHPGAYPSKKGLHSTPIAIGEPLSNSDSLHSFFSRKKNNNSGLSKWHFWPPLLCQNAFGNARIFSWGQANKSPGSLWGGDHLRATYPQTPRDYMGLGYVNTKNSQLTAPTAGSIFVEGGVMFG